MFKAGILSWAFPSRRVPLSLPCDLISLLDLGLSSSWELRQWIFGLGEEGDGRSRRLFLLPFQEVVRTEVAMLQLAVMAAIFCTIVAWAVHELWKSVVPGYTDDLAGHNCTAGGAVCE